MAIIEMIALKSASIFESIVSSIHKKNLRIIIHKF